MNLFCAFSGLSDPFEINWLDTKVDLLDLIADDVSSGIEEMPTAPDLASLIKPIAGTCQDDSNNIAIQVLQSVADDTMTMLKSEDMITTHVPAVQEEVCIDLLEILTSGMDADFNDIGIAPIVEEDSPILSPVTPEDVESLLSSGPSSPVMDTSLVSDSDSSFVDASYSTNKLLTMDLVQILSQIQSQQQQIVDESIEELEDPTYTPSEDIAYKDKPFERKTKKNTPTSKKSKEEKVVERKLRKKQQNKDAATRYRMKKKNESNDIQGEREGLEKRNVELKDKVGQMTREISYLKSLFAEIYQARVLLKKSK